jgi:cysteine desulfurase
MIYFDNSATTKMSTEALTTYEEVVKNIWGNPSSLHQLGDRAHQLLEAARKQCANLLGVKPCEIFFTSGGTESDNWGGD